MAKAELKTKETKESVKKYIDSITNPKRKKDAVFVSKLMQEITGDKPKIWGTNIVGFGKKKLIYASGRELDWMKMAFSMRKDFMTLYLTCDINQLKDVLEKLGKYKTGKGCLYIKSLDDVDLKVLKILIKKSLTLKM